MNSICHPKGLGWAYAPLISRGNALRPGIADLFTLAMASIQGVFCNLCAHKLSSFVL